MVPPDSDRVSRVRPYSGTGPDRLNFSSTGLSPCVVQLSRCIRLSLSVSFDQPYNPDRQACRFGLIPVRSPLLGESLFCFLFLRLLRCFSSAGLASLDLCIQSRISVHYYTWVAPFGYPRIIALFQLPEAFRRYRVLLRLLMPRHPSAALTSLTENKLIHTYA